MDTTPTTDATVWPLIDRRKPDEVCEEMHAALVRTNERLAALERRMDAMDAAFMLDDLGEPNFSGHRAWHLEQKVAAEKLWDLKQSGAKKLIDMLLVFLGGVLLAGALSWIKNPK